MAYDRKKQKPKETATIEIRDGKTNEPTGMKVTVYGPSTEHFDEASDRYRKRNLQLARRFGGTDNVPARERNASLAEFLADVTTNIEGLEDDGQPVPYSRQEAVATYAGDHDVAAQVSGGIADRQNF